MASADNVPACKGATWDPRSPIVCNFWDSDGTKYDGVCDQDGGCVHDAGLLRGPDMSGEGLPMACGLLVVHLAVGERRAAAPQARPPLPGDCAGATGRV
jgi:hypothetical protein